MTIKGKHFENQKIFLDDNEFVSCPFVKCELIFESKAPFVLDSAAVKKEKYLGCPFTNCKLIYEGKAPVVLSGVVFDRCELHSSGYAVKSKRKGRRSCAIY